MDIWNLRGHAAPYDVIIPMVLERIKEKHYGLFVLDPIYELYGDTDENAAGDVAALMNALERLAVRSKAAVVFGAHFSKGNQANKQSIDKVSGSGVYGRDPDSILNFSRHEEDGALVVEADLRNLKPLEKFVVR
jgi:regulatory protein RepA